MSDAEMDRSQITVLIVDDEPENLEAFARALRGYTLLKADRGDRALQLVAERAVNIILTDQSMPGTRGAQVLQRARAVNPGIKRVVVSGVADTQQLLETINCGEVERYLLKPVQPQQLRAVVDQLALDYLRAERERREVIELQDQLAMLHRFLSKVGRPQPDDRLEQELARSRRYGRPLSLVHIEGAAAFFEAVRGTLRELDLVSRQGESLILCLPETPRASAEVVLERLRPLVGSDAFSLISYPEDDATLGATLASWRR